MSKCHNCNAELDNADSICPNCGAVVSQDNRNTSRQNNSSAPVIGNKNVIAGDIVDKSKSSSVSPMIGDKNVIAGDVIGQKVMGDVIYNVVQDDTKRINVCAICGRHITNDEGHTCPKCNEIVCSDCFDIERRCCKKCANTYKDEIVVDKSGAGDAKTINDALQLVKKHGIIRVRFGCYEENLLIDKPLSIIGEVNDKGEKPIICGDNEENVDVIKIQAEATIKNLSVTQQSTKKISDFSTEDGLLSIYDAATIEDCNIYKTSKNGIVIKGTSQPPDIKNCKIFDVKRNGVLITSHGRLSIENCIITHAGTGVHADENACCKIHSCDIFENTDGIIIEDDTQFSSIEVCKIYGNKGVGVGIKGQEGLMSTTSVKKSEIFENKTGIYEEEYSTSEVSLCQIYKNHASGIEISGSSGKYENCDVFENNGPGIHIDACETDDDKIEARPTIKDCKIYNGKNCGIEVEFSAEGAIINCEIFNNDGPGIRVAEEDTKPTIRQCKIHNGKKDGILIENGADAIIEECNIFDNSGENIRRVALTETQIEAREKWKNMSERERFEVGVIGNSIQKAVYDSTPEESVSLNKNSSESTTATRVVSLKTIATNNKSVASKELSKIIEKKDAAVSESKSEETIDPRRLTNIDWYKKTPTTLDAWNALTDEQKKDWAIWNQIKSEYLFAMVAMLLEIVIAITVIASSDFGVGMSVLVVVVAFAVVISTAIFRKVFYNALRALVAGGLVGSLAALITYIFVEEGTLRTIIIILLYVACIALFGFIVSKGGLDRKIPKFPEHKG